MKMNVLCPGALIAAAFAFTACSSETASFPNTGSLAACEAACASVGQLCNPATGRCVECLEDDTCPGEAICAGNICIDTLRCGDGALCPNEGICGDDGYCIVSRSVPCQSLEANEYPVAAVQIPRQVVITWNRDSGWTTPDLCMWECGNGFVKNSAGNECVDASTIPNCKVDDDCDGMGCADGFCRSSKTVPCSEEGRPEGEAAPVEPEVTVTWDAALHSWTAAERCQWKCADWLVFDEEKNQCRESICGDGKIELNEACDTGALLTGGTVVWPEGKDTCTGAMNRGIPFTGEISCASDCTAIDTSLCRQVICTPGTSCRRTLSGETELCIEDGTGYAPGSCGEGYACSREGVCAVSCVPGACRMDESGTLEICSAQGDAWRAESCPEMTSCVAAEGEPQGRCLCADGTCNGELICVDGVFSPCAEEGHTCRMTLPELSGEGTARTAACVGELYCETDGDCAGRSDGRTLCDTDRRTCVQCFTDDECTGQDEVCFNDICQVVPSVFISEYIEGNSHNKALEIFNGGSLSASCVVNVHSNGAEKPRYTTAPFTVAPGSVHLICNQTASSAALQAICAEAQKETDAADYSGDDALTLVCNGFTVDIFGRVGEQPGLGAWSTESGLTTRISDLRRKCFVRHGVMTNPDSGFPTLAAEWTGHAYDDYADLGKFSPVCSCSVNTDCDSGLCGSGGICAASRSVPCTGSVPEHAVVDNASVSQTWSAAAGWVPANTDCVWSGCEEGFWLEPGGGSCAECLDNSQCPNAGNGS